MYLPVDIYVFFRRLITLISGFLQEETIFISDFYDFTNVIKTENYRISYKEISIKTLSTKEKIKKDITYSCEGFA